MQQGSELDVQRASVGPLVGLSLTMLLPSLATSTTNVALPALARTFGASFQSVQWIVLSYLLTITALIVAVGRLGDIFGQRRLLLIGTAIFAGGSALSGVSPTLELLIAARVIQGLGAAIMMTLTIAFAGAVVPPERTGSAMGLLGTMSAVGTTLGPAVGGLLVAWAGSRAIFLANVPLAVMALLITMRSLPRDLAREGSPSAQFDFGGMALLAVALTAYALALTLGRGQFGLLNLGMLFGAFLASVAFFVVECKVGSPLLRLELFRNRALATGLAANMIVSTVMMATLIVGPFYLAKVIGLGPATAGLVLAFGPLVAAMAGVPAGRLVDRFGTERVTLAGLAALAAGAAGLSVIPAGFGIGGYILPTVTMTAGYAIFQAGNNTTIITVAAAAERGVVSGMVNLSRNLGLVTGASAMGALFAWGAGTQDIVRAAPEAIVTGLHATFAVAALLIAITLLSSLPGAFQGQERKVPNVG